MKEQLSQPEINPFLTFFRNELEKELKAVLSWWMKYTPDKINGGFWGLINAQNQVKESAEKGLVLNSRILWTFSAAFLHSRHHDYLSVAERAFKYLTDCFYDRRYGGMYWSLNYKGFPVQDKKQVYGMAFSIYGLSEYYQATRNQKALDFAKELFMLLEKHNYDPVNGGYLEAFTRDWKEIDDMRLSSKDLNEKKSMNTHLHVLEAYVNLYKVWKSHDLAAAIQSLLYLFTKYIVDPVSHTQNLFFTDNWISKSETVSFGHDIEASWLLYEAAKAVGDDIVKSYFEQLSIAMTNAALAGIDNDGGIWYEYNRDTRTYNKEKHWWPQAEALVGFFNAYGISGNTTYLRYAERSWNFIKEHICNKDFGEWNWGIKNDGSLIAAEKAGFWKCPYHNARACMEVSKRITALLRENNNN